MFCKMLTRVAKDVNLCVYKIGWIGHPEKQHVRRSGIRVVTTLLPHRYHAFINSKWIHFSSTIALMPTDNRNRTVFSSYLTFTFTVTVFVPASYCSLPAAVTATTILYVPFFVPFFTVITPVLALIESFLEEPDCFLYETVP